MKQALRVAFGFLMLWAAVLHAEVRIEITQGVDSARPIGVVPFQWAGPGAAPEDIGGVVAADLRNSGKFNPLDRSRLPQQPGTAQEVQPAAWSALGIDAVVVGQVTGNPDGSYNVAYQLVDTGGAPGTILAQNSYKVTKQYLRYAAHTASDAVFEKLTSIKGAFRTRIAYVVQTNGGQFPYELRVSDYDGYIIDFDALHDSYMKATSSMHKAYEMLIEHYNVYIVAPAPTNDHEYMAKVQTWVEEYLSTPAYNHINFCNQKNLLYGDYFIDPSPCDGFMGTTIEYGSDEFKTFEEIITFFERLGGQ